jgi:hypothetical protein
MSLDTKTHNALLTPRTLPPFPAYCRPARDICWIRVLKLRKKTG